MYKTHTKRITRKAIFILVFCLLTTMLPTQSFAYSASQLQEHSTVSVLESGKPTDLDYLNLQVIGSDISVTFKHSGEFDRIVLRTMQNGASIKRDLILPTMNGAGETLTALYSFGDFPNGEYYFRIVGEKVAQEAAGLERYSTYLQGVLVSVSNGIPSIEVYHNIVDANKKVTNTGSANMYKDTALEDLRYQLFAKAGTKSDYRTIDKGKESTFYRDISDKIVSGATSDYDKLRKIYTFVAENFYYDHYGVAQGKQGYDDPFNNLQFVLNGTGNNYNAFDGKVAVQCDGYAGAFTALARAQGIPCRMIYGRKITSGTHVWAEEADKMEKSNHTWVQAWVDNRWVNIDPQQASYSSYTKEKAWKKTTFVNYTFFDISDELFAYSHYAQQVVNGSTDAGTSLDATEAKQLKAFLNVKSSGKTNGKRLNSKYSASNASTWGNTETLKTNGNGRIQYINWPNKALAGKLNLSNFKELKNVTIYKNKLTGLTTTGCAKLETMYASSNNIKTVNLSASKKLKKADFRSNPLTKAQLYTNKKTVTISATGKGTFGIKYENNKITITPKAKSGYKYAGLYSNGKLVSKKSTYTFKATKKTYTVKFVKK